jgi:hypothetical protein
MNEAFSLSNRWAVIFREWFAINFKFVRVSIREIVG